MRSLMAKTHGKIHMVDKEGSLNTKCGALLPLHTTTNPSLVTCPKCRKMKHENDRARKSDIRHYLVIP